MKDVGILNKTEKAQEQDWDVPQLKTPPPHNNPT